VLVDAVRTRETTVYTGALPKEKLTIAPLLGRNLKSVQVSFRF
jgi:hypothetical protein